MKYSRHPQKFDNPDPELQKQWLELKDVLCDNEFMIGYKIMIGQPVNMKTIWHVITTVHTDTSNIWSHLIAMILFTYLGLIYPFPVCIAAYAPALTFAISSVYHVIRNYSRRLYDILLCLDVSSIGIQICGFLVTGSYSFFWETRRRVAIAYLAVGLSAHALTILSMPFILRRKLYWVRTFVLSLETMVCLPIVVHKYWLDGIDDKFFGYVWWQFLCVLLAGMGILVRSAHVPERFFPRTIFQLIFHSHVLFHILTALSAYCGVIAVAVLQ
jgi:predicted membrane channel-forming protein YqfA (hemolysin III family)